MHNSTKGLLIVLLGALMLAAPALRAQQMTDVNALARSFVAALAQENYTAAYGQFNGGMQAAMPVESLQRTWAALTNQSGALQRVLQTHQESVTENGQDFIIVYVTSQFAQQAIDIKVVFDTQQKISGLWFVPASSTVKYQPPAYVNMQRFSEKR